MLSELFFVFPLVIIASFIQRVTGFGFGIFIMMFLPLLLPTYGECVTLSGLLGGTTSLIIAIKNYRYIRYKLIGIVLIFNLIASYIVTQYMVSLSPVFMKQIFGLVLITLAFYFLYTNKKVSTQLTGRFSQACIGITGGIMGGMFAMPGPPSVFYLIGVINDKREYVATLQALFFILNIFYTLFRLNAGFWSPNTFNLWLAGLFACFIGAWLGARLSNTISLNLLKRIVYLLMILSGIMMLFTQK